MEGGFNPSVRRVRPKPPRAPAAHTAHCTTGACAFTLAARVHVRVPSQRAIAGAAGVLPLSFALAGLF